MGDRIIIKPQGRFDEGLNDKDFRILIRKELENIRKAFNGLPFEFDNKSKSLVSSVQASVRAISLTGNESLVIYTLKGSDVGNTINLCSINEGTYFQSIIIKVRKAFPADNQLVISDYLGEIASKDSIDLTTTEINAIEIPVHKIYEDTTSQLQLTLTGTSSEGEADIIPIFKGFTRL